MKPGEAALGRKVRALRIQAGLTQVALAGRLRISPSYLNLIEHDRRRLSAEVLIRLANEFQLDLPSFAGSGDQQLVADLMEVFGDPVFGAHPLTHNEIREFATSNPGVARAVVRLHHSYAAARESADTLAERAVDGQDVGGAEQTHLSTEQVSDLLQSHLNYFPALEAEAEKIWRDGKLERDDRFAGLTQYLQHQHGVTLQIRKVSEMGGATRRFLPERGELHLSEALRRGSRNFQLAHQIGLLSCSDTLDEIARHPLLTSEESRALCRVALANYFAGAVLMPYADFLQAAQEERYDIEVLGHRFRTAFEQICHRFTTLQQPGATGVPFYMVRVDIAGNISKKFSAWGIRFPRFSGLCPLWNVHAAFLRPGMVRVQLSRFPDGTAEFSVARTVEKHRGGYQASQVLYAIGLGCDTESARKLVYADGIDLRHMDAAVPVGVTCRACERTDCPARAFPSLQKPLRINEHARGVSFFAPVAETAE